ncbi:hypothetical protein ACQEVF_51670 [Nonomuraea polychroma]|uniref:hypothetical protein n=1 Tax=Nonomuraea polychroma TaxID=46176 RepID=UPI003D90F0FB
MTWLAAQADAGALDGDPLTDPLAATGAVGGRGGQLPTAFDAGQVLLADSGERGLAVSENVALIIRFRLVGGEDISVMSGDFDGEPEAVAAVARAVDEQRSLVLMRARYDREADVHGVVINLANVVSVRVSKTDSAEAGQYL